MGVEKPLLGPDMSSAASLLGPMPSHRGDRQGDRSQRAGCGEGRFGGTGGRTRFHQAVQGGGNLKAPLTSSPSPGPLSCPSLPDTPRDMETRPGLKQKLGQVGQTAQVRKGTRVFPLQKGGSGVWQVERQRAAQQAGKQEQVHEGGAETRQPPGNTFSRGTAISN